MSAESQEIFVASLDGYQPGDDPSGLRAAATGHLGASRSMGELTSLYASLLESGDHEYAQQVADELAYVRMAERVRAGGLPGTGG